MAKQKIKFYIDVRGTFHKIKYEKFPLAYSNMEKFLPLVMLRLNESTVQTEFFCYLELEEMELLCTEVGIKPIQVGKDGGVTWPKVEIKLSSNSKFKITFLTITDIVKSAWEHKQQTRGTHIEYQVWQKNWFYIPKPEIKVVEENLAPVVDINEQFEVSTAS